MNQLLEIRIVYVLLLTFIFSYSHANDQQQVKDKLSVISASIKTDIELAIQLSLELKETSENSNDPFGIVKSNFMLGYVHYRGGDYGKAIIYYLEALRLTNEFDYDTIDKDIISINKNCGVLFRRFKSYNLATEYYQNALLKASQIDDTSQVVSVNYNLSGVYIDQEKYQEAVTVLNKALIFSKENSEDYFKVANRLSNVYFQMGKYDQAEHFSGLITTDPVDASKKIISYAYQNLGLIYNELGDFEASIANLRKATEIIQAVETRDQTPLFRILVDLGSVYQKWGNLELAMNSFSEAEGLIPDMTQKPEFYELFKREADLYYEKGDFKTSKHYEQIYYQSLKRYVKLQQQIQETDQRYNMDLITKRYFDQVEKQEQIADIMFYAQLISGLFLFLFLSAVGYNIYSKYRLRRSIEKELLALHIID